MVFGFLEVEYKWKPAYSVAAGFLRKTLASMKSNKNRKGLAMLNPYKK
jgi:hypothetical protein